MVIFSILFSVLLISSFIGIISFVVKAFHSKTLAHAKPLLFLICVLVFAVSFYFFMPFHPVGYGEAIIEQHVFWSGTELDVSVPACKQPEYLSENLMVRRYRLTDWPAPGHPIGTPALHVELELENGNSCILILTPNQIASSRIYLYDDRGARTFFLTKQSALDCLSLFLESTS